MLGGVETWAVYHPTQVSGTADDTKERSKS